MFGDALAASIPAQVAGLMSQPTDAIPPASSLTLVNLPQADEAGATASVDWLISPATCAGIAAARASPNTLCRGRIGPPAA